MFKVMARAALRVGAALGIVVSGLSASAQQFSGDLLRTDAGSAISRPAGKLNVSRNKVRIETSDVPGGFFLVLGDDDAAYFVRPTQKIYMDAKQSSQLTQMLAVVDPDDACARWRATAIIAGAANETAVQSCKRFGQDTVNGRRAIKYWGISAAGRQYFSWIDPELRFPVRLQYEDGEVVDLTNIQEVPQLESLFVVPAGSRKFYPQQLIDRIKQSDVWVEPVR
jgi:hypothetical protein